MLKVKDCKMNFEIHSQLQADTHQLGKLKHAHVLLHKNAVLPWFILVPETDVQDLLDLPVEFRNEVLNECAFVASFIKRNWSLSKINFAGLGNVVPQLHLHIIGRRHNDNCWPKPVWGNLDATTEYTTEHLTQIREALFSVSR